MNAAQPGALTAMKNTSGLCISRTATRLTRLGKTMSDTQDPLERAHDAALDAETAKRKAEQAYEQALAEETYFYGVQVWMGGRWIMMLTRDHGTSLMHRGKWFEHKHEAEECAAKWNHDTPTRIVRQRRSPVEVINE